LPEKRTILPHLMNKQSSVSNDQNLKALIESFVNQLAGVVEEHATKRVQAALLTAFGAGGQSSLIPRRRGRPPKNRPMLFSSPLGVTPAVVRKRPKQLCPVPGCANVAAPVFGMVCSKHKDVAKTVIRKYRAQRRATKGRTKSAKAS
jgi:hypothetical protein